MILANVAALFQNFSDIFDKIIAQKIKELIAAGAAAEEIAVLYHNNKDVVPLAAMLEKQGVLFTIESNQDVLGDEEI